MCLCVMSVQHLCEQTGFELQKIDHHSMNEVCLCTVLKLDCVKACNGSAGDLVKVAEVYLRCEHI